MPQESHYGISGLATAPNPVIGAPPGALSEADNCVIRRPGMIEPRPGFKAGTSLSLDEIWKFIPYANDWFAVGEASAVQKTKWSDATDATSTTAWTKHQIRAVEARKNLYMTTSDAVRKFTSARQSASALASLRIPMGITAGLASGVNVALINGKSVAYRAVFRRTDANGVIVRSSPSGRAVVDNDAGGNRDGTVIVQFGLSTGFVAGDVVEVYRTYNVTTGTSVPDEMFKAFEHTITSGEASNGVTGTLTDTIADAALGAALYSNATQEGISRANVPPPVATDLALFNGSLFASNIRWPSQLMFRMKEGGDKSASATGIGFRIYTGTRTNGSNQITGLSSVVGLEAGQMLSAGAGWSGSAPVIITSVGGATATMSATWNGATDGAPVSLTFFDTIRVSTSSGEDQYYGIPYLWLFLADIGYNQGTVDRATHSSVVTATVINSAAHSNSSGNVYGDVQTVLMQTLLPSTVYFTLYATHGSEYDPVIPAGGLVSTQDSFPNGLTWSKQDEPEHFMRGALWLVGNARAPIIRIVALRDELVIFKGKGDGIYRLTGFGELSGWDVKQVDPTVYLLHPETVTVLEDQIYAWTSTGMCRVDSSGQEMLSKPIIDLTGDLEITLNPNLTNHAFAFAAANLPDHEVIFGLPMSDTDGNAVAKTYCYNTFTGAWTQWFGDSSPADGGTGALTMAFDPYTNLLMLGTNEGIPLLQRGPSETYVRFADLEYSVSITAVAGDGVTCTIAAGAWVPAVGDLVRSGSAFAVVVSTANATHFVASNTGLVVDVGAVAYVAFTSRITWLPKIGPTGALYKRFSRFVTHWDDVYGLYGWSHVFAGVHGGSLSPAYTRTLARSSSRTETRALMTQAVALETQIQPTLIIKSADARWRVTGLSEAYEEASTRVSL